jgi:hypothetical protein
MHGSGKNDREARSEARCAVKMSGGEPCGRPIHPAPEHDRERVCLMHSKDPAKSDAEFQKEFERVLAEAERTATWADFTEFVFSSSHYSERTFAPACLFRGAKFAQDANFSFAKFPQGADFSSATFTQGAYFILTTFTESVTFVSATFTQGAYFVSATFTQGAYFVSATFTQDADFIRTTFTQGANFSSAKFTQGANFSLAKFTQGANFSFAKFTQGANFRLAMLSGSISFRETHFRHDITDRPGLIFTDVKIEHPEQVEFHTVNLGQALFYNTDVSKFDFTLVTWRDRRRIDSYRLRLRLFRWRRLLAIRHRRAWIERWRLLARIVRRRSSRICTFDEEVNLTDHRALHPMQSSADERNYDLLAETYQQLKRNYDAKGDFRTAGHWHYSEMDMKRLHSDWRFPLFRWLSRHFSLAALYRYASDYGESYLLPLWWMAGVLAFFALVYPMAGLELNPRDGWVAGYWNYTEFFQKHPAEWPTHLWGLMCHSFMTSISVAGFQRELRYMPNYPLGRMLGLLEVLLTTTLGGLFALAIRRQFKRS